MAVSSNVAEVITRLVKPSGSKLSTRETIEAHADKICRTHNEMLTAMQHYLDTGEISTPRIREWADGVKRDNARNVEAMRAVLKASVVPEAKFQGLSDAAALEAYGRVLLNLFSTELLGQGLIA